MFSFRDYNSVPAITWPWFTFQEYFFLINRITHNDSMWSLDTPLLFIFNNRSSRCHDIRENIPIVLIYCRFRIEAYTTASIVCKTVLPEKFSSCGLL